MSQNFSFGLKIIWIELAIIYLIPWLINLLIDFSSVQYHYIYHQDLLAIFFIVGFGTFLILFDTNSNVTATEPPFRPLPKRIQMIRFVIACLFLVVGFMGYRAGLNNYRNAADSAFAEGGISYFLTLLPIYFKFDLLYSVFFEGEILPECRKLNRATKAISSLAFILGLNGIASGLLACVYLFQAAAPVTFQNLVSRSRFSQREIAKYLVVVFGIVFMVAVGWFVGEASKFGGPTEMLMERIRDPEFFSEFIVWMLYRISITYYSFLYSLHHYFLNIDSSTLENLRIPFDNLNYRIGILFGDALSNTKPLVQTVSRLNCELVSVNCGERAGTSPGLLASFLMCFPFPLNLFSLTLFALLVKKLYNQLGARMKFVPNLTGMVIAWWMVTTPLATPIDMLTLIDESFITFLGITLFAYDWRNSKLFKRFYRQRLIQNQI